MKTGKIRVIALASLALASCSRAPSEDPLVVLDRAATKAQSLDSAAFDIDFSYSSSEPPLAVSGTAEGVMAHAGRQLSLSFRGNMRLPDDGPDKTVSIAGNFIVADTGDAYLRIQRADGSILMLPGVGLIPDTMLDTWYSFESPSSGVDAVSPDPSYLAMQTSSLSIVRDRGIDRIDGYDCYRYDVAIDREKLLAFLERTASEKHEQFDRASAETFLKTHDAQGRLWIDVETSVIRRIEWQLSSVDGAPAMDASFALHLQKHGETVEISPPSNAIPFSEAQSSIQLPAL